jgi:hypothetical protein
MRRKNRRSRRTRRVVHTIRKNRKQYGGGVEKPKPIIPNSEDKSRRLVQQNKYVIIYNGYEDFGEYHSGQGTETVNHVIVSIGQYKFKIPKNRKCINGSTRYRDIEVEFDYVEKYQFSNTLSLLQSLSVPPNSFGLNPVLSNYLPDSITYKLVKDPYACFSGTAIFYDFNEVAAYLNSTDGFNGFTNSEKDMLSSTFDETNQDHINAMIKLVMWVHKWDAAGDPFEELNEEYIKWLNATQYNTDNLAVYANKTNRKTEKIYAAKTITDTTKIKVANVSLLNVMKVMANNSYGKLKPVKDKKAEEIKDRVKKKAKAAEEQANANAHAEKVAAEQEVKDPDSAIPENGKYPLPTERIG